MYIEMAKEQPAFSLKRRKQDHKNSDSASIRDECCISYIQVSSLLMEKTAFQILFKCCNLHIHTCTFTCAYTACGIFLWKLLQTGLGDRRQKSLFAIVLAA